MTKRLAVFALLWLVSVYSLRGQLIEGNEEGVDLGAVPSDIQPPTSDVVQPLLEAMCPGRVIRNAYFLLGCDTSAPEPGDDHWRPPDYVNGVLFGHFLSSDSQDVILSSSRYEGHPLQWGGTMLMTRENGLWKPIWYRSGIITRHCMKLATFSGQEILVCDLGTAELGHTRHALYSIELRSDNPVQELLLATDTYDQVSEKQTQTMDSVQLVSATNAVILRVHLHHERRVCNKEWSECGENDYAAADPPPGEYSLEFALQGSRLVISPAGAPLFSRLFPELAKYLPEGVISYGEPPGPH